MIRRGTGALVACALVATFVATLASGCDPFGPAGVSDDSVVVIVGQRGLTGDPYSPFLADRRVGRLVFRGLFTVGPDGGPVPDLATEVPTVANGGLADGGRTVLYRLRDDAEWHDGTPVTARDVAFTIQALLDGALVDDPGEDFGVIEGVEVVDDTTVRVTLSRPDSVLAWRLAPYVLPAHLLEGSGDLSSDRFWDAPTGSGPYTVTQTYPNGDADLEPAAGDAPSLLIRSRPVEADAAREFATAPNAVWLDTVLPAGGPGESASTTWGPFWRRLVFNVGDGSVWADPVLRGGVALMTTTSIPATLPPSAFPYGVRPPTRSVADTVAAGRVFDAAGYTRTATGSRARAGERLALELGMEAVRPEQLPALDAMAAAWTSTSVRNALLLVRTPIRRTWPEAGEMERGLKDGYLVPIPAGRPFGWAFPYASDAAPSWQRPWGLNYARSSDPAVHKAFEAARTAADPEAARKAVAEAGRRIYETNLEITIEPIPERLLYKGVDGVQAWPVPEEALAGAVGWRARAASSEATAAR